MIPVFLKVSFNNHFFHKSYFKVHFIATTALLPTYYLVALSTRLHNYIVQPVDHTFLFIAVSYWGLYD